MSPPLRRRDIIERQKYPCSFIGAYYEPARAIIVDRIVGRCDRTGMLQRAERLVSAEYASHYARHQANSCAEAVLCFLDLESSVDLGDMTPVQLDAYNPLDVEGVRISVYPDVLFESRDARGRRSLGAIKLHFPKSHPHTEASGQYVATLLRMYAKQVVDQRARVRDDACVVIDVFAKQIIGAPRGYIRRWRDIGAACQEICRAWSDA